MSKLPPNAPLRHLDLRENCENNGIAEEKVLFIRAALLHTRSLVKLSLQVKSASKGGREILVETLKKNTQRRRVRR